MHDKDAFVDQQRQNGLSGATIKRRVSALKVFFDFLAEESSDLSWPNPVRFKRHAGKQPQRLPRDLSDEQVELLRAGEQVNTVIEDLIDQAKKQQSRDPRTWIDDVVDFVIQILNDELHITTGPKISQYLRKRMQDLVVTVRME